MRYEDPDPDDQVPAGGRPGSSCVGTGRRKDFTAHQLFAVLALETFLKTDYRGVAHLLADFAEIWDDLGLAKVAHDSTRCDAAARLLKNGDAVVLLVGATTSTVARGRFPVKPTAAIDATGLDSRHTFRYFARLSGAEWATWSKVAVACDTATHFLAGATVTTGPTNDPRQFQPVLTLASLAVAGTGCRPTPRSTARPTVPTPGTPAASGHRSFRSTAAGTPVRPKPDGLRAGRVYG